MPPKTHRLKQLAEALDISVRKLETNCNIPVTTLAVAIRRGSGISTDIVNKITARYGQVNGKWLKTGEGEMFLPAKQQTGEVNEPESEYGDLIPLTRQDILNIRSNKNYKQYKQQVNDNLIDSIVGLMIRIDKLEGKK